MNRKNIYKPHGHADMYRVMQPEKSGMCRTVKNTMVIFNMYAYTCS